SNVTATVTTTDGAGNSATATDDKPYDVDVMGREARRARLKIGEDGIVNESESKQDVAISGTVGKDVKEGDVVTITIGTFSKTTTVQAGGTWTVDVPGSVLAGDAGKNVHASVTTQDTAGNPATATDDKPYDVD